MSFLSVPHFSSHTEMRGLGSAGEATPAYMREEKALTIHANSEANNHSVDPNCTRRDPRGQTNIGPTFLLVRAPITVRGAIHRGTNPSGPECRMERYLEPARSDSVGFVGNKSDRPRCDDRGHGC